MTVESGVPYLELSRDMLPRLARLVQIVMDQLPLDEHTALALLFAGVDAVIKCGATEEMVLNTVKMLFARGLGTELEPS